MEAIKIMNWGDTLNVRVLEQAIQDILNLLDTNIEEAGMTGQLEMVEAFTQDVAKFEKMYEGVRGLQMTDIPKDSFFEMLAVAGVEIELATLECYLEELVVTCEATKNRIDESINEYKKVLGVIPSDVQPEEKETYMVSNHR